MTKHDPQKIYKYICGHIRVAGYAPTVMEIMAACGIPSKSNVKRILDALKADGLIDYQFAQARTITVIGSVWLMPGDRAADIIARLERLIGDLAAQVVTKIDTDTEATQ